MYFGLNDKNGLYKTYTTKPHTDLPGCVFIKGEKSTFGSVSTPVLPNWFIDYT